VSARPFSVHVGALRGHPGEREEFDRTGHLDEIATSGARVDPESDIKFVGTMEGIEGNRVVVVGDVVATWRGDCRRCLVPASGEIDAHVREIFEDDATEGETYPLDRDVADLEPLVREALMLEMPIAPLCREDCKGLCPNCGANRNETDCGCDVEVTDPRWAALDVLKDDN
jgi:uncharacterized protein